MKKLISMLLLCTSTAFADYGITKIHEEKLPNFIQYGGRAIHSDKVSVITEEGGYITKIAFKNGDSVKKGDVIMELSDRELEIEVARSKQLLIMAKTTYDKYNLLFEKGLISEPELFTYRQEYVSCKSDYDLLAKRIEDTKVRASKSGLIGNIEYEIGDYIEAGTLVAQTASKRSMDIIGHISSEDINDIRVGSPATIIFESMGIETIGKITEINPFIDEELKKFEVVTAFENRNNYLLDNIYGDIRIEKSATEGIQIPSSAVLYYDLDTYVYIVDNGRVKRQRVLLGRELPGAYVIEKGLKTGDTIVTKNLYNLTEGQTIN